MATISLDEDDGYVTVKILDKELKLDLFRVFTQLREFWRDHAERNVPEEQTQENLRDLVSNLGFPPVSVRLALRFNDAIREMVEEIKKKEDPKPESDGSTASTPSA